MYDKNNFVTSSEHEWLPTWFIWISCYNVMYRNNQSLVVSHCQILLRRKFDVFFVFRLNTQSIFGTPWRSYNVSLLTLPNMNYVLCLKYLLQLLRIKKPKYRKYRLNQLATTLLHGVTFRWMNHDRDIIQINLLGTLICCLFFFNRPYPNRIVVKNSTWAVNVIYSYCHTYLWSPITQRPSIDSQNCTESCFELPHTKLLWAMSIICTIPDSHHSLFIKWLVPDRCDSHFKSIIFKYVLQGSNLGTCCEIDFN